MKSSAALPLVMLVSGFFLVAIPVSARADALQCPSQITVHEQTDAAALTGWQVFNGNFREVHHFYGVAFSQGPPADLVYLNPRKATSKTKGKVEVYDFGSQIQGDLWISCQYRDTSQIIAHRLDPKPLKCQVVYDAKRVNTVTSVTCD
jgi:hypothetical protein